MFIYPFIIHGYISQGRLSVLYTWCHERSIKHTTREGQPNKLQLVRKKDKKSTGASSQITCPINPSLVHSLYFFKRLCMCTRLRSLKCVYIHKPLTNMVIIHFKLLQTKVFLTCLRLLYEDIMKSDSVNFSNASQDVTSLVQLWETLLYSEI